ncbi:MAG: NTP transferase domain-containing protein [Hyphomicrobiaceae bacterium]
MKFARFPISEAQDTVLAHSVRLAHGILKKGRRLSADDVRLLEAAGIGHVIAARLEADDIGEDDAAHRIARVAAGTGLRVSEPFTGRCNLFADTAGIAVIDADLVSRINALDEGLTVATVPRFERVTEGQMIATIKIITFAVPERVVAEAERLLGGSTRLASVRPFRRTSAGLVLTRLPNTKDSVLEKRRLAIADRLSGLGSRLIASEIVDHEEDQVAAAIKRMVDAGAEPIIIFAASAIVDRGDVIPAALVATGGVVKRLGMPVDPGNMMLLGAYGEIDVIGAPSCAASPKLNGFDWVLDRLLAGLEVDARDVGAMGVGGLLKEIASRPQPREGQEGAADDMGDGDGVRRAPRIAAIVLAAGRSRRFGTNNKLLADLAGEPVVRHAVRAVLASRARPVVVVTGHMADEVRQALVGLDVSFADSPDYRDGMAASLKAGLAALPKDIDGVLVALGDMPSITGPDIDRLVAGFAPKEGRAIMVPVYHGKRGNPVLFATHLIPEMAGIAGDAGAKQVIGQHADEVTEVGIDSPRIFVDVDTPEALDRVRRGE